MDDLPKLIAALAVIAFICVLPIVWKAAVNNYKLSFIPTVGSSGLLTSYIDALRYFREGPAMVQEGYKKYRGMIFKVPTVSRWLIIVSGSQMIEDIHAASEDEIPPFRDILNSDLIVGPEINKEDYHIDVIKGPLTRNIRASFADVQDEIATAFDDHISLEGNEWVTITAYPTIMEIVVRTSNRMLVGLPLCRDPDYVELNQSFTDNLIKTSQTLDKFPKFLRPFALRFLPEVARAVERGMKHLEPLFTARLEQEAKYGKDWPGKPNDAISWIMDYSNKESPTEQRIRDMILRILMVNFTAIHTTSLSFTNALFDLATRPEYVQPMRDEIEAVVQKEGWSKDSVAKLRKIDSFIKETLRVSSLGSVAMYRKMAKDFTFSNGLTVPAGNIVAVPRAATHSDPDIFSDAGTFDGFRFEKMRDQEGPQGTANKHQMISLDPNYLTFGYGRHACPGRFFVTNELKTMLAHVLLNYDVRMANGSERPAKQIVGASMSPNPTARVMFRKRV